MLESIRAERSVGVADARKEDLLGCHVRGNVLQDLEFLGIHADSNLWHHHSHLQPEFKHYVLHSCLVAVRLSVLIPLHKRRNGQHQTQS